MNKNEFKNYMFEEFPSVFENSFSKEMLSNILDYAEGMEESEQYNFLCAIIPEVTEQELRKVYY